jgi:phosphotransferase system HPr-like phosphotransfer protein
MRFIKTKFIKLHGITEVAMFVSAAGAVQEDITGRKGRYCIDCKSLLGVLSFDTNDGFTVEYPEDATEFEEFISQFEKGVE